MSEEGEGGDVLAFRPRPDRREASYQRDLAAARSAMLEADVVEAAIAAGKWAETLSTAEVVELPRPVLDLLDSVEALRTHFDPQRRL